MSNLTVEGTYRTQCCKEPVERTDRAKYLCKKCNKDVSMDILFYVKAIYEDFKTKEL